MNKWLVMLSALVSTGVARAYNLGHLFTTPAQRALMDGPQAKAQSAKGPVVTVQGLVQRRGGAPVVFLNGEPLRPGDYSRTGVRVIAADVTGVTLEVPGTRSAVVVPLMPTAEVADAVTHKGPAQ